MMHDWGFGWGGAHVLRPALHDRIPRALGRVDVALVRRLNGGRDTPGVRLPATPREILDERFAKGEIDREDYEARPKAFTDS